MLEASRAYVPVFVDTLNDLETTRRFDEKYGSYPVLRIHDHDQRDLAGRIDGNRVAGKIPVAQLLDQLRKGLKSFQKKPGSAAKKKPGGS